MNGSLDRTLSIGAINEKTLLCLALLLCLTVKSSRMQAAGGMELLDAYCLSERPVDARGIPLCSHAVNALRRGGGVGHWLSSLLLLLCIWSTFSLGFFASE